MTRLRTHLIALCLAAAACAWAQTPEITIETPPAPRVVGPLLRPFHLERRVVSPATLTDSPRLESLIRAGNLYLSVQDVIALALENNVDIAIQRYGPYLAREVLRRAQGGGFLRSVGQPISPGPISVSLEGVNVNAVGLPESGSGVGSGGGIVIQLGTPPPNLDPVLFAYANFQHSTTPLSNIFLSWIPFLLNNTRVLSGRLRSVVSRRGTSAQLTFASSRNSLQQPGVTSSIRTPTAIWICTSRKTCCKVLAIAVNNRNIRVAKNNMKVTDLQLKRQVITTVSAVLNLYWDLVSFNDDLRIKQEALDYRAAALRRQSSSRWSWARCRRSK